MTPPRARGEDEEDSESSAAEVKEEIGDSGAVSNLPGVDPPTAADPKRELRTLLSTLERDSQNSYDKAILTLSGGALGVTISFVKNVIGNTPKDTGFMFASWICWGLSLACILFSFFASNLALRRAVIQLDNETIEDEQPGGALDIFTAVLNAASGGFFLVGISFFVYFGYKNIGG